MTKEYVVIFYYDINILSDFLTIRITQGNAHARIICEVGNAQNVSLWNTRCEMWMHEEYVRCVFGIKIYPKTIIRTTVHQPIIVCPCVSYLFIIRRFDFKSIFYFILG